MVGLTVRVARGDGIGSATDICVTVLTTGTQSLPASRVETVNPAKNLGEVLFKSAKVKCTDSDPVWPSDGKSEFLIEFGSAGEMEGTTLWFVAWGKKSSLSIESVVGYVGVDLESLALQPLGKRAWTEERFALRRTKGKPERGALTVRFDVDAKTVADGKLARASAQGLSREADGDKVTSSGHKSEEDSSNNSVSNSKTEGRSDTSEVESLYAKSPAVAESLYDKSPGVAESLCAKSPSTAQSFSAKPPATLDSSDQAREYNSRSITSKRDRTMQADGVPDEHNWKKTHYNSPTWCDFCENFIWGLGKQGYRCQSCKSNVHAKCRAPSAGTCGQILPGQKKMVDSRNEGGPAESDSVEADRGADKISVESASTRKATQKSLAVTSTSDVESFYARSPSLSQNNAPDMESLYAKSPGTRVVESATTSESLYGKSPGRVLPSNSFPASSDPHAYSIPDVKPSENSLRFPQNDSDAQEEGEIYGKIPAAAIKAGKSLSSRKLQHSKKQASSPNMDAIEASDLLWGPELGRGAYGVVFDGRWQKSRVAIKVMTENSAAAQEDFEQEASLMQRIAPHPFVVQLLGVCQEPFALVTEFMENGSLDSWLQTQGALSDDFVLNMAAGIACGVQHLHDSGIVHRDLAARNVLINQELKPKISDFGQSRIDTNDNTTKSETGPLKWMAPEAIVEHAYSTKTDTWAFGITMVELASRTLPYPGLVGFKVAMLVVNGELTHPIPDGCPALLADVLELCFQYKPEDRPDFATISSMLARQEETR